MRVLDNGPGIRDEDKKRIFDRFYRVDKARTRQKVDLVWVILAKQIVEAFKGTIKSKDNKPKGTIFEVKLSIKTESRKKSFIIFKNRKGKTYEFKKCCTLCPRVENLEKSIAFYQDAFGFEENVGKISQTTSSRLFIWPCLEMTMSWN